MPTQEKAEIIEATRERYSKAVGVIFTEYRGLKVKQLQELRTNLRDKGGEIHVVKNTLFRIAAGADAEKVPIELTSGPTAVAFLYENEPECAKALLDYGKTAKNFVVKGGFIGGKPLDGKQVEAFSKLPPREVLIAQVIGAIAAPLTNLVSVIESLYADPIRVIGAVADKVAEGSPLPEPKAEEAAPATEEVSTEAAASDEASDNSAVPAEETPATDTPESTQE